MKKKLLDRRGAAIELAIMMMVFSIFITTIVLTTALLQNSHKAKAELGIEQDIFLEQLGEDFIAEVLKDHNGNLDWHKDWKVLYDGVVIEHGAIVEHKWVEGETVSPTCEDEGYTSYTCVLCKETKRTNIQEPLGHKVLNPDQTKGSTCSEEGMKIGRCQNLNCEKEDAVEKLPLNEHSWIDTETTSATCTENGYYTHTCSVCGVMEKTEIATPALGHICNENEGRKNPCTGKVTYVCTVCGESYEEIYAEETGHDYIEDSGDPLSCEKIQTCSKCEDTQTIASHNWGEVEGSCTGSTIVAVTCATCGLPQEIEIPATEHKFDEDGFCAVCRINKEEIRYSLIVIKLKNGDYMLRVDALRGSTSEPVEDETVEGDVPAEEDICPTGGTLVLKITVSQLEGIYKITEWSKK